MNMDKRASEMMGETVAVGVQLEAQAAVKAAKTLYVIGTLF